MNSESPFDASRWARLKIHLADLASMDAMQRADALDVLEISEEDRGWLRRLAAPLLADDTRLAEPHPAVRATIEAEKLRWRSGETIGRYRIESLLGRGGMGEVYAARSLEDDQIVALKVLRAGLDQRDYARFSDNEQRALRRLDDPRIAKFIEAFVAEDVGTCLVLEWVDGEPLQSYCRDRRYAVEARLRLFVEVCHAVASAHRQLVVHRDLKPSNVLITPEGQVKLLDFGVSKLLDDGAAPAQTHGDLFTLDYAAPEQVLHEPVSTATDIYALGGLLFRLLTDISPYTMTEGSLVKAVLGESPQKIADGIRRSQVAGKSPPKGTIDADLDRVVQRSMEKDPRLRYGSALELAGDVDAILSGRPISSDGRRLYRFSKFARRHRASMFAATVATVALVVALGISIHEVRLTALHAHRADVANNFLLTALDLNDRFSSSNRGEFSLADVLDRAVAKARTELADEPVVRAMVLGQLGIAQQHQGKTELALSAIHEAYELRRANAESTPAEKASVAQELASVEILSNLLDQADVHLHEALHWLDEADAQGALRISAFTSLGMLASMRGKAEESLRWYEKIVPLRRALPGDHRADIAMDDNNLATGFYNLGRFAEADIAYARGIALLESAFGSTHPRLAFVLFGRAAALIQLGRFGEARALLDQSEASLKAGEKSPGTHPGLINSDRMRATLDYYTSDYASALRRLNSAIPQIRVSSPVSVAAVLMLRGRVELAAGDPVVAEATFAESEKIFVDTGRGAHAHRWLVHGLHGVALAALGNVREGDSELDAAFSQLAGDDTRIGAELADISLLSGAAARRRGDLAVALQRHRIAQAFQVKSGWLGDLGRNLVMAELVLDGLAANADAASHGVALANLEPTILALRRIAPNVVVLQALLAQRSAQ